MLDLTIRRATAADADMIAAIEPDKLVSEISRDEQRDRFLRYLGEGLNVSLLANQAAVSSLS